jgi:polyisoprenoid-binding protein YceI
MKKTFLSFSAAALLLMASCASAPDAAQVNATEAQAVTTPATGVTYNVDLAQSNIGWVGTKPTGKHNGTIMLKDGTLVADQTNITGGKFTIDMTSLKALDQDTEGNTKLGGHLSSADFFDIAKFPTATFEITEVKAGTAGLTVEPEHLKDATHTITGNLTMKGVTKSISFPARVSTNNGVTADANFNIDRTQWGLSYGAEKSLGDKMINSIINLNLHLVARAGA